MKGGVAGRDGQVVVDEVAKEERRRKRGTRKSRVGIVGVCWFCSGGRRGGEGGWEREVGRGVVSVCFCC